MRHFSQSLIDKPIFRVYSDLARSQLFSPWLVLEAIRSMHGGNAHSPAKNQRGKINIITWILHDKSINNSILRSHEKIPALFAKKLLSCGQTTYAQIWSYSYAPNLY